DVLGLSPAGRAERCDRLEPPADPREEAAGGRPSRLTSRRSGLALVRRAAPWCGPAACAAAAKPRCVASGVGPENLELSAHHHVDLVAVALEDVHHISAAARACRHALDVARVLGEGRLGGLHGPRTCEVGTPEAAGRR